MSLKCYKFYQHLKLTKRYCTVTLVIRIQAERVQQCEPTYMKLLSTRTVSPGHKIFKVVNSLFVFIHFAGTSFIYYNYDLLFLCTQLNRHYPKNTQNLKFTCTLNNIQYKKCVFLLSIMSV